MPHLPLKQANIIEILEIESLSSDRKEKIVNTALKLIDLRSLNTILDQLEQNERDQLSETINEKEAEDVLDFLESKDIDFFKVVEKETEQVKKELAERIEEYELDIEG